MTRKPRASQPAPQLRHAAPAASLRPTTAAEDVPQPSRFDVTTYVTFKLGDEEYGIAFLKVRELLGMHEITRVPHAQEHLHGMIDLRGKLIPVLDLRAKLGLSAAPSPPTAILIVQLAAPGAELTTGILVDEVLAVRAIRTAGIEVPLSPPNQIDPSFLLGVAKLDEGPILLLDIDRVLADPQHANLSPLAQRL
jgi:purine-binding chemotaxis protein CheW